MTQKIVCQDNKPKLYIQKDNSGHKFVEYNSNIYYATAITTPHHYRAPHEEIIIGNSKFPVFHDCIASAKEGAISRFGVGLCAYNEEFIKIEHEDPSLCSPLIHELSGVIDIVF